MTHEERQATLRRLAKERAARMQQVQQSNDASQKRVHSPLANQQGFSLFKTERI